METDTENDRELTSHTANNVKGYRCEEEQLGPGGVNKERILSFKEKWENVEYKHKFIYSMCMAVSFVSLGMFMGQHGPTFLDLQIITNTDLQTASALFTGGNAGYLAGSILVGLIYNKVNTSMLSFVVSLCLGISNVLMPYCSQFELMVFVRFIASSFGGALDTGLNSEHMTLWGSSANGLLQFLHACFSLGGVISPLFAEPFLAEKSDPKTTNFTINQSEQRTNVTETIVSPGNTNVQYVFLITGIFTIVTSLPFIIIFFRGSGHAKNTIKKRNFSQRKIPLSVRLIMLSGICSFYFTYCCVEDTFFSFLMTFLVQEYEIVSKSKGAFVTAIAWAAFALSRFLMIFVTKIFSTIQILLILTTAMVISFSSFAVFAHFGIVDALIVISAVAALAFSGVFPAGLSWTERDMFPVTGVISSCVFVSSSLGSMVNPLILGQLMEQQSNMWFCYLLLMETFIMYFLLIILLVFCRFFVDRKYGSLSSHTNTTRNIEIKVSEGLTHDVKPDGNDVMLDNKTVS